MRSSSSEYCRSLRALARTAGAAARLTPSQSVVEQPTSVVQTNRVERLLRLIQSLQAGRAVTVDELAQTVGVSRRTVFRDLDVLTRAGLSFDFDRATKRYHASRSALLPPVTLTHAEALSVLLATRAVLSGPLPWDQNAAESAAIKIESMMPTLIRDHCGSLMDKTVYRPAPASDPTSVDGAVMIIQSALVRHVRVYLRYDSHNKGDLVDTTLCPYRLAFIHRAWYVIGYSTKHASVRTFKLERIVQLRLTDESYREDARFSLDDYFGNAWMMIPDGTRTHVKIRFSRKVATNVEEVIWHKTQRTTWENDGSLLFEVDVDGTGEIGWWILGYGAEANVLEPPELRARIAKHIARMYTDYGAELSSWEHEA